MKRARRTREELEEAWTLGPDEHVLLSGKRGPTRLGFAVLLRFFAREGRFPGPGEGADEEAVAHVAGQVGVPAEEHGTYDRGGRTAEYHRAQIREALGFRPATVEDAEELVEWLLEEVAPREHGAERVREEAYVRLRALKIEPPTPGRIERAVRSAIRRHDELFCERTSSRLSEATKAEMTVLLGATDLSDDAADETIGGDGASGEGEAASLARLRTDPGLVGVESAFAELAKLERLRSLGLPGGIFGDAQPKLVRAYRRRAAAEPPSSLRAHPPAVRHTLLAALCHSRLREVTDGLVDLLVRLVHKIGARAERKVERIMLDDLRRVTGKTGLLFKVAEAALAAPDGSVREVVFPVVNEGTLEDLVREAKTAGAAYRAQVQTRMRSSYVGYYRRVLPPILAALEFRSNNAAHRPVVRAVGLLKAYSGSGRRFFGEDEEVPLEGVVAPGWRDAVLEEDGKGRGKRVDRAAYELCVLVALREGLRSKEVWVVGRT